MTITTRYGTTVSVTREAGFSLASGSSSVSSSTSEFISLPRVADLSYSIIPIYYLVRKPTLVLDFACTLTFLHVVITTYHAGGFPTTFFFWAVMIVGTVLMIIGAEQVSLASLLQSIVSLTFGYSSVCGER